MVEHQDVVGLVADGGDLFRLELVAAGQVAGDSPLLACGCVTSSSRAGRPPRHMVAELLHGGLGGLVDGVVVVADRPA